MSVTSRLSARDLNRATLARQLLLERRRLPVVSGLRSILAVQAQDPPSPFIALWNRLTAFDPDELHAAFDGGHVVKATLMRITLHAVAAEDYPVLHAAMQPSLRASRLYDRRFKETGLTIAAVDAHEPRLLAGSTEARTTAEMTALLRPWFGDRAGRAWWAYRTYAPFHHRPTGGRWAFGPRAAFVAAPKTLPAEEHERAVAELVVRYLRAFGPAEVADVAQFTLLKRNVVRQAVARLGDRLVRMYGPAGGELIDAAGAPLPGDVAAPPRLLPMWESILLAHAERGRFIPPEYRPLVIRRNGDVLPTLLVDGTVVGVWRPRGDVIEATTFRRLSRADWTGLSAEAAGLLEMLDGRDADVYGRYERWWRALPATETRVLPG